MSFKPSLSIDKIKDTLHEEQDAISSFKQAMSFIHKVRDNLHEKQDVQEQIFQLIGETGSGNIGSDVTAKVEVILKGHDDLLSDFNVFLPNGYKIEFNEHEIDIDNEERVGLEDEAINFIEMVKEKHADKYEDFLKSLVMYGQEKKEFAEVRHEITNILNDSSDLLKRFENFIEPRDIYKSYGTQVTPSYKLLLTKPSQTSEVLNNTCGIVQLETSSTRLPRSRYEECVENVEDERFESDRIMNLLQSVIYKANEWLEKDGKEETIDLNKNLTPMDFSCIKNIWPDYDLELKVEGMTTDDFRKKIQLIVKQLENKLHRLVKRRTRMEEEWIERLASAKPRASRPRKKRKYLA